MSSLPRSAAPAKRSRRSAVMRRWSFVVSLLGSFGAFPVVAQDRSPFSVDITVGPGVGVGGGVARQRAGLAADGIAAWRVRSVAAGQVLVGVSGSAQVAVGHNDLCEIAPGGGCVPDFPQFYSAVLLAGMEIAMAHGASVRLLGGPGYYREDEGDRALGFQGRVDLATASWHSIAFVASLRGAVLPTFRSTPHGLGALGFGLRLQ